MTDYLDLAENNKNLDSLKEQLAFSNFWLDTPTVTLKPEPFLKWAGGKSQLLRQFEQFFPAKFNRYYEPFLGSGAVFFHLQPTKATISDANPNLIATYKHIQNQLDDLVLILGTLRRNYHALTPTQQELEYYKVREKYNQLPANSIEKSALLIFLNKTCYNGLYRENKKGGYNVPFGRYDNPGIFDENNLRAVCQTLQGVEILNSGFNKAIETVREGDFVYFDPPYVPVSKTASFTSYTKYEFGTAQQSKLAEVARSLAKRGALIMLSNSESVFIRDLYKGFEQYEVKASRAINSKGDSRGKVTELVITNYKV